MDETRPPRSGKAKTGLLLVAGMVVLTVGFWALNHFTRDVQEAPPKMLGSV